MRLIDADTLIKEIQGEENQRADKLMSNWYADIVAAQPTIFDAEKICMELSENRDMDNLIDVDHAIKIVKSKLKFNGDKNERDNFVAIL